MCYTIFFKLLVLLNYSWMQFISKIEIVKVQAEKWKTSLSKLARCLPCFWSGGEEKEWQIELQQHSHIWWESQVLDFAILLLTTNECSHISKQNLRFCAICRFLYFLLGTISFEFSFPSMGSSASVSFPRWAIGDGQMLFGYDSMNDDDASLMLGVVSMEVRKSTRVLTKTLFCLEL